MKYYSKTTGGFYDAAVNKGGFPADAVSITDAEWLSLLSEQSQGKVISTNESGKPVAVAAPVMPAPVPTIVTPFQAKAALYGAGLLPAVEAIISNPATPVLTKLAWAEVTSFTRDSPLLNSLAGALGLTSAQVDALFVAAAAVEA